MSAAALDALARLPLGPAGLGLCRLGQSSFALRARERTLLVDPFLSAHPDRLVPPPFAAAEASGIDAVLVTHDHLDHLDDEALAAIAEASPEAAFVVPVELVERVAALGIDRTRVAGLRADASVEIGGLRVHAVPACHGEEPADAYRLGPFLGYVVDGGTRVYHAGDTILFDGLAERLRVLAIDVALLPVNGRDAAREAQEIVGNLDEPEAVELAVAVGASILVPMHYDMFASNPGDPAKVVAAARAHPELGVLVPPLARPVGLV